VRERGHFVIYLSQSSAIILSVNHENREALWRVDLVSSTETVMHPSDWNRFSSSSARTGITAGEVTAGLTVQQRHIALYGFSTALRLLSTNLEEIQELPETTIHVERSDADRTKRKKPTSAKKKKRARRD